LEPLVLRGEQVVLRPYREDEIDAVLAAMRTVLDRAGFELEAILRAFMPEGAGRADYALYALTAAPAR
jgi:hypothetical protein